MGGAHAHSHSGHGDLPDVETARVPRLVLLASLALAFLATLSGLVALWPDGERPTAEFAAEGVTFPEATVVTVHDPCPVVEFNPTEEPEPLPERCDQIEVERADGSRQTIGVPPGVMMSSLQPGDTIKLADIPETDQDTYFLTMRQGALGILAAAFVAVVALVARWRGILALVGLGFAALVFWQFILPALLDGRSGSGVALVGSSLIMFVVLYLAHGPSVRTSTALAGTLAGCLVTAALAWWAIDAARLNPLDENGGQLRAHASSLDFTSLLTCAVIIAGLGVLNDVTITQSSAVWELRAASPTMTRLEVFAAGMRIGRDHIASTIYTIVFAYAGTALSILLLVSLFQRPALDTISADEISVEIVRTLTSGIGLVLAVPITTAIAAATVAGPTRSAGQPGHSSGR